MPLAVNLSPASSGQPVRRHARSHTITTAIALAALLAVALLPGTLGTPVAFAQSTVIVPAQPNNDFQEASIHFRNGQYDSAMARVDAWLKTRPKDARGRFLRGMIRLIVGMCINVGLGQLDLEDVKEALDNQTPLKKSYSVPPTGLFLKDIQYPFL